MNECVDLVTENARLRSEIEGLTAERDELGLRAMSGDGREEELRKEIERLTAVNASMAREKMGWVSEADGHRARAEMLTVQIERLQSRTFSAFGELQSLTPPSAAGS
jgi:hypothetical protein